MYWPFGEDAVDTLLALTLAAEPLEALSQF